ncbi:MAG: hypothetical protein FWD38_00325 [Oscillospiraceae bacterium]|nr:hypothetical protein [Oscillospiraceae bacterium]
MSDSGGSKKINLKEYAMASQISDAQIGELLYGKVSQCSDIKSVTPNPTIGIASIIGKFYNFTVEHKHEKIFVRPKMNYNMSVILSMFSIPFALWIVYTFDFSVPFKNYALPLALLLISYGISWFIGYTLGDIEQKSILSYIYNILNNDPPDKTVKNTKTLGTNKLLAILPFLAGIIVLVLFFVL